MTSVPLSAKQGTDLFRFERIYFTLELKGEDWWSGAPNLCVCVCMCVCVCATFDSPVTQDPRPSTQITNRVNLLFNTP